MTLLRAEGLRKSFGGVHAVKDVSFDLDAGEIVAIIGPNGAGKSTCFNLLNGQLRPDAGRVLLDGRDIAGSSPQQISLLGAARTFQVAATFSSMSVRENVQMPVIARKRQQWRFWRPAAALHREPANALLSQLGLLDQAGRQASVLAYGDLKRLELAIALASEPRLLLMDEPTAGMAVSERRALLQIVRQLAPERRIAVLFTGHDMDFVFGAADRIVVLDRGMVIAAGKPPVIRADATVRAVYLGS